MKNIFEFLKKQYLKYKEIINYLIFGVLTTIVNFVVYIIFARLLHTNETISNAIAWIISVLFAYITNKIYVFDSKEKKLNRIIKEIIAFFGCRAFSGAVDIGSFYLLVNKMGVNDIISKVLIAILVVILNYIFSKLLIFKKSNNKTNETR